MELDFDKEIDALLRKEGAGRTITISEFSGMHLDADEIAAFGEGAVPLMARAAYTEHFAECDQCRRALSNLIVLNAANGPEPAAAVIAPAEPAVPWYRRLLIFPNLAYVMGGLVVLFAGFIGLSVMTRTFQSGQSDVSRISEIRAVESGPAYSNTNAANLMPVGNVESNALASANTASNAAMQYESGTGNTAANSFSAAIPESAATPVNRSVASTAPKPPAPSVDGANTAPPAAAPPASAEPKDAPVTSDVAVTQKAGNEVKAEREQLAEMRKDPSASTPTQPPVPASRDRDERSRNSAALKRAAPVGGTAAKKEVRGRSFEFRQGAWYDTTYRGQGTINVRRNSDEYRKLDQGLRGIAESLIGTVVTLWNGKAYRIQ